MKDSRRRSPDRLALLACTCLCTSTSLAGDSPGEEDGWLQRTWNRIPHEERELPWLVGDVNVWRGLVLMATHNAASSGVMQLLKDEVRQRRPNDQSNTSFPSGHSNTAFIGATIPHVDILSPGGRTLEYQLTGAAAQWGAGVLWSLGQRWAVLAEYKGTRSWNEIDLQGGGRLETNIDTQALNLGLSYRFGTPVPR